MAKTSFTPLDSIPKEEDLTKMINNLEYKKIEISQLPSPLDKNGLVSKCNSFVLASSGSTDSTVYSFVGIRPDHNNVDEHPIVLYYDRLDQSKNFGGIIHHGNWPDRTVPLTPEQTTALSASGITANFTYKSIPSGASGSLNDLNINGMLQGLSAQFDILLKNKTP